MNTRAALVCAAAALLAASCSGSHHSSPPSRYVALGDSYAAGILTDKPVGTPAGCLRSADDYPHVVQRSLHATTFADVTCNGATTADVAGAQDVLGGRNAPQLNAVTADTTLVTITLGGNDIGFVSIIAHCASLIPAGSPCKNHYVAGGRDQLAAQIAATAPKIAAVLAAVHRQAPRAQVLLVGYPDLLPPAGGCWPRVPFTDADANYLRGVEVQLDAMLAAQARAGHARYVDTYTPSLGHDMCRSDDSRWVEPLLPTSPAAPFHPNAIGEAHMAGAVLAVLGRPPG